MHGPLHIIEPTLTSDAGHCSSFIRSICAVADASVPIRLWAGKGYLPSGFPGVVQTTGYFSRRWRLVQCYLLYRALLRQDGRIFVATAGRTDLLLLNWAASGLIPAGKVFCFFHWLRLDAKKQGQLARIAVKQPGITFLAPTELVATNLRGCGFPDVRVVPYPITPCAVPDNKELPVFSHLVSAGAARADKGIGHIAAFIGHLAASGEHIPVIVQTSADHYDKYDETTRQALEKLAALKLPSLSFQSETLPPDQYDRLFAGAICLQPYNRHDFTDRVSGITLDALSRGAPVVTIAGTWIARVVERFSAGEVLEEPAPEAMLAAILRIKADYHQFQQNALRAGETLQSEYSAGYLYRVVTT